MEIKQMRCLFEMAFKNVSLENIYSLSEFFLRFLPFPFDWFKFGSAFKILYHHSSAAFFSISPSMVFILYVQLFLFSLALVIIIHDLIFYIAQFVRQSCAISLWPSFVVPHDEPSVFGHIPK